jgi:hypothetical protein
MSLEDLDAYVWQQLSARRHMAGKALVSRLAHRVVRKWPHVAMSQTRPEQYAVVTDEIARSIERSERQNYKMGIILTLVLGVLIQEIVKAVLRWWLESASNRIQLLGWQTEMRKR